MSSDILTEPSISLFESDTRSVPLAQARDFEYGTSRADFTYRQAFPSRLVYLDPRPAPSELGRIYPREYEPYRFESFPWLLRGARDLVQRAKVRALAGRLPKDASIIDVGCGSGTLLRLLRSRGPRGWQLHANDLNAECLRELAQQGFKTHSMPINEVQGQFDAVILNQVIEHFSDVEALLASCLRILKPQGILFIETPSTEGPDARIFKRRHWGGYHCPRHFYLFDAANLAQLLGARGFEVVESRYLASPAFWCQSLHHLVADRASPLLAAFFQLKNLPLTAVFTLFDTVRAKLGYPTSNMRVVARKP